METEGYGKPKGCKRGIRLKPISPEGYTSSVSGNALDGYTITNTRNQVTETSVSVMKLWVDDGNADGARPVSLPVRLLADGTVLQTVTLSENNQWRATVEHLPVKKADGSGDIVYSWEETEPDGYILSGTLQQGTISVLINTRIPELMDIPVRKVWEDNGNAAQTRPEAVTVQLFANGTARVNGRAIHYSVSEDTVPLYVSTVNGFTITNTYRPETTAAAVTKIWNDGGNELNLRPQSVRVTLSNGQETVAHVMLSEENGWSAAVSGLPTVVNGREAVYTWTEEPVIGYDQESVTRQGNRTIITNKAWEREAISENRKPKRAPGNTFYIFEDYETPLGVEIMINHVGDCFD